MAALPTGTVTFLFTGSEGSPRSYETAWAEGRAMTREQGIEYGLAPDVQ